MSIRMNRKFVLSAFASVFLLSAVVVAQLIVAVAAQPRIPGVSPGDWVSYSVTFYGNGTMPGMENVTWAKITVQEISGTNITFEIRAHYPNATEETDTMVLDVDTGQGNGTSFFIAANLNAGDLIYNSTDPYILGARATINETIFRTYAIGNVEVNHWNVTTVPEGEGWNQTTSMNYYWYKSTGMITEVHVYTLLGQAGNMTWYEYEIVMIDIIPEFPPALIPLLFMIATLTAVWLGKTMWSTKKSINKPSPCEQTSESSTRRSVRF